MPFFIFSKKNLDWYKKFSKSKKTLFFNKLKFVIIEKKNSHESCIAFLNMLSSCRFRRLRKSIDNQVPTMNSQKLTPKSVQTERTQ